MKNLKPTLATIILLFILTACKKSNHNTDDTPLPKKDATMIYTDLSGKILKPYDNSSTLRIDLNKDGIIDVNIHTLPVGATDHYELQFLVTTPQRTYLSIDADEQTAPLAERDKITIADMAAHHWYDITAITLMRNIVPAGDPYWDGNWQNVSHKYLPVMQTRGGANYLGWIELSTHTQTGTIELYRAAMSTEANKEVRAGI